MTADPTARPNLTTPCRRQLVWYAGRLLNLLVTAEETAGRFSQVEELVRKDAGLELPQCVRTRELVCTLVVAGEVIVRLDGEARRVTSGACAVIPPGTPYRLELVSDSAHLVHTYAPGGFEGFFRELGEPAKSVVLPPASVAPLDVERLVCVAARYGVEIIAPEPDQT